MTVYNTVTEYIPHSKTGDRVAFGGRGIIDGLKNVSKMNTYRITKISNDLIKMIPYRCRTRYIMYSHGFDQPIAIYDKSDFKNLPTY